MDYKHFYKEHWWKIWLSVLVLPPLVLALGCVLLPDVFWDGFVYKYLWGPVVADAKEPIEPLPGGISEGYTIVSTMTYAIVLAVAVLGMWRAFRYLRIQLDARFLIATVPWIVLGSELRALEDASLFSRDGSLVYIFISPLIYMLVGLTVFGLVIVGTYIERLSTRKDVRAALPWLAAVLLIVNVPPALFHALAPDEMAIHAPYALLPGLSVAGFALLWWRSGRTGRLGMRSQLLVMGSILAVLAAFYVASWSVADPWITPKPDPAPAELGIILLIALGCTAATAGAYWLLSKRWSEALAFIVPVAILLFLAHFIDGAATYRGLDAHGYSEKHVLPTLLIELTGTAAIMLPLKFLVVTAVIYLLDIAYAEDLQDTPTLTWLVKVAIMVLGLAPGIRDTLRLVMGV